MRSDHSLKILDFTKTSGSALHIHIHLLHPLGCLQLRNSVAGSFVAFPPKRPRISSLFRVFGKNVKEISGPSVKILPDYYSLLAFECQDLRRNTATPTMGCTLDHFLPILL